MEIWFLSNEKRLFLEVQSIKDLESKVDWLTCLGWKIEGLLRLEAIIHVDDYDYNIVLNYPNLFPDTPAWIKPIGYEERQLSEHQFGAGGSLCLEWGPDNWHPELTGADLLKSAYKLLNTERPHDNNNFDREKVLSRHSLTLGQDLLNKKYRFFVSSNLIEYLNSHAEVKTSPAFFTYCFKNDVIRVFLLKIKPADSDIWNDTSIPQEIESHSCGFINCKGMFYRISADSGEINRINRLNELEALLIADGYSNTPLINRDKLETIGFSQGLKVILLVDKNNNTHTFLFLNCAEDEVLIKLDPVLSEILTDKRRIPEEYKMLTERRIGIVGLGSVGSKIADSLARAGIKSFYLIDDDVFLPENLYRNILDWSNVIEHKVEAIANKIRLINPNAQIMESKLNITEQGSSLNLNTALIKLGECDLIIDATANPKVFNILASVSKRCKKPLVWGEVYEGGIGGFIARSRPGIDPEPLMMRTIYQGILQKMPPFDSISLGNYEAQNPSGNIISASDSQVSIISANLANFAMDSLMESRLYSFTHSMYLIGLAKGWIFNEPFDVKPIETPVQDQNIPEPPKRSISNKLKDFITEALENSQDEDNTTENH